jgi:modification methylase
MNFNDGYYLPTYEVIYLIAKPEFQLIKGGNTLKDIWRIKPTKGAEHPAEFPIEIPLNCIKSSGPKIVFDPFLGSGNTIQACVQSKIIGLGCEINPEYEPIIRKRSMQDITKLDYFGVEEPQQAPEVSA